MIFRKVFSLALIVGMLSGCDSSEKTKAAMESVSSALNGPTMFEQIEGLWLDPSSQTPVALVVDGESLLLMSTEEIGPKFAFTRLQQTGSADADNRSIRVSLVRELPYFGEVEQQIFNGLFSKRIGTAEIFSCVDLLSDLERGGNLEWVGNLAGMAGGAWLVVDDYVERRQKNSDELESFITACASDWKDISEPTLATIRNVSKTPDTEIIPALIFDNGTTISLSFTRRLDIGERETLISKTKAFRAERERLKNQFRAVSPTFSYEALIAASGLGDVQPGQRVIPLGGGTFRLAEADE